MNMIMQPLASEHGANAVATGRAHFYPDVPDSQWNDWKWQVRNRVTKLEELAKLLPFPPGEWDMRREVLRDFRMGITPYYLSLVNPQDRDDPIACDRDDLIP